MNTHVTRHYSITGVVQGVGYRWSMRVQAMGLGLDGWVRNRRDGSVEAVASGPATAVAELTEWARRGPPGAVVMAVRCAEWSETVAAGFHQLPTE